MAFERIRHEALVELSTSILEKLGYPAHKARITAAVLAEADARGVSSHGVTRLKVYRNELEGGHVKPQADPEIVHETPISLVVDGHYGVGAHISEFTMKRAIEKAKAHGTCYASVRNSNHFGMAGLWAEMAVKEGVEAAVELSIKMAYSKAIKSELADDYVTVSNIRLEIKQ